MQFNELSWQGLLVSVSGAVASGILSALTHHVKTRRKRKHNAARMRRARAKAPVALPPAPVEVK